MSHYKVAAAALFAAALFGLPSGDAQARIVCEGNFQIVNGLPVSTPYCREQTLGRVARSYGWSVSDRAIRYSESAKADVCRAIGYDTRVQEICGPYQDYGGGNRFRF